MLWSILCTVFSSPKLAHPMASPPRVPPLAPPLALILTHLNPIPPCPLGHLRRLLRLCDVQRRRQRGRAADAHDAQRQAVCAHRAGEPGCRCVRASTDEGPRAISGVPPTWARVGPADVVGGALWTCCRDVLPPHRVCAATPPVLQAAARRCTRAPSPACSSSWSRSPTTPSSPRACSCAPVRSLSPCCRPRRGRLLF